MRYWTWIIVVLSAMQLSMHTQALDLQDLLGDTDPAWSDEFVLLPRQMRLSAPVYLKQETYDAFTQMYRAAKQDWIDLRIRSGYRTFQEQATLFATYGRERALPPGTSPHNFGNAIDLASVADRSVSSWLADHAATYWFCQTFDGKASGQMAEPRHFEYKPAEHRQLVSQFADQLYISLVSEGIFTWVSLTKQAMFARYIYPFQSPCSFWATTTTLPYAFLHQDTLALSSLDPQNTDIILQLYHLDVEQSDPIVPETIHMQHTADGIVFAPLRAYAEDDREDLLLWASALHNRYFLHKLHQDINTLYTFIGW